MDVRRSKGRLIGLSQPYIINIMEGTMKLVIDLFIAFAKIGSFTFGGGYAMLPMIKKEVVERHGWASDNEILDYFAISQVTPGVIAVNTATFVGYKIGGLVGAIAATLGVIFPSIVIIAIIAAFLTNFASLPAVVHAFNGIRACVCVLILNAVYNMAKKSVIDIPTAIIFILVAIVAIMSVVSPFILVILAGVLGFIIQYFKLRKKVD